MMETDSLPKALLKPSFKMPDWVPETAQTYLAHTEAGLSIRALARAAGCHASTILRQIRRIETRRDDPLVDAALRNLGQLHFEQHVSDALTNQDKESAMSLEQKFPTITQRIPQGAHFNAEAARVLSRLCETNAVLAVAADMEKAVIVRDGAGAAPTRTGVVDRQFAEALALKEWITARKNGKITRYTITAAGRCALENMYGAEGTSTGKGFCEAPAQFVTVDRARRADAFDDSETERPRRMRYNLAESPLTALARRKDKNGAPFLSDDLVTTGERLREDFELAQMGPRVTQDWDRFLTSGGRGSYMPDAGIGDGPSAARQRIADALTELGPGLSDVVLRCCCYLEGLETAEKKLGWSARSGKIVLRIALLRLKRHYDETVGPGGPLIG